MTLEERVAKLEKQFANFNRAYLQSQKNQTSVTSKVDTTSNNVETLTPYTDQKNGYIGDTEVLFTGVPAGKLSVFIEDSEGNYPNYTIERISDKITVSFDPLEYVATITISVS